MPPHDTYIELFAGSGAVLLRKPPAARSIAVELDGAALRAIGAARRDVECHRADAIAWIAKFDYAAAGRVLVYADPPYLHSTRSSRARYKHELSESQHEDLTDALRSIPANVILSGYPSEHYDWWLSDWHTREFQSMTRGGVRTEKLWFNFEPDSVHWSRYAGRNFTDRQRIRRKAERWAANYQAMPAAERTAVFAAIMQIESAGKVESIYGRRRDLPET